MPQTAKAKIENEKDKTVNNENKKFSDVVRQAAPTSASHQQPQQQRLSEPQPEAEEELLTTLDILPIKAIGRGCIALPGGRFSTLLKLDGVDMKLMSQAEKNSLVYRLADLFN